MLEGGCMDREAVICLLQEIARDRGIPRNIRDSLEDSINVLNSDNFNQEAIASVESILEDASNDHNVAAHARTNIWNIMSTLEEMKSKNQSI
jgi:uncharacterized protein (UPF0147 family)